MATHEIAATTPDWKAGVPWLGEWEGCTLLKEKTKSYDVKIVSDGVVCKNIPKMYVRQIANSKHSRPKRERKKAKSFLEQAVDPREKIEEGKKVKKEKVMDDIIQKMKLIIAELREWKGSTLEDLKRKAAADNIFLAEKVNNKASPLIRAAMIRGTKQGIFTQGRTQNSWKIAGTFVYVPPPPKVYPKRTLRISIQAPNYKIARWNHRGSNRKFKIGGTCQMGKVFEMYNKLDGCFGNTFKICGQQIKPEDTPNSLELEDEDEIDVSNEKPIVRTLTIRVIFEQDQTEMYFKANEKTKMSKIFKAYSDRKSLDPEKLHFFVPAKRKNKKQKKQAAKEITSDDTCQGLEMCDHDWISCVLSK